VSVRLVQALLAHIALPADATEQLASIGLSLALCQQPQTRLDDLALRPESGRRHSLGHHRIVDLDVGSHRNIH
jgi:hypothetical protein